MSESTCELHSEERQPDEVLREKAREWLSSYKGTTSQLSEMLAAFAQSIQAESRQEESGQNRLDHPFVAQPQSQVHSELAQARQQIERLEKEVAPREDAGGDHHPTDCIQFPARCGYCNDKVQRRADYWHAHYDAAMGHWKQAEQQLAEARAQAFREAAEIARKFEITRSMPSSYVADSIAATIEALEP